ncbi:sugar phosphate isomerase/epimerase family protein [Catalinimonas niigatensis]|uniref:sugar phosphate isomerase/epimerase family protein n=1 Tax=Catalinimonas niigatensis TaxID=1397264 RepID=UPI002664FEB4|nr:sugar phosphate isomerase/epimerase family protein [Catalinimonas niigatensis]WPP52650.1 sugar phosphate isomerase/epimerase family protein [Catalinimonas niigatensis]
MENKINRRSFVKSSSTLLAGLSLGTHASARHHDDVDKMKGVQLAIATICLDGFGDENFEPSFKIIPQTGIKNVEFNVWYPRNITPSGIESIQERCYENGLKPISLQGTAFGDNVLKDVTHKLWLMDKAKALGCRRVKFTGAGRGKAGGLENVIETLKALAPAAEEMDVLIAVENHANNNIENIEDYEKIFAAVDSTHVGMCLDMGHFDGASVSNFDVVERFHEKINHVDLKDVVAFGTYKSVPYGEGITRGEEIVKRLIDKGYSGYLVIEQAPPMEGLELAREMRRIKDIFAKFEK